MFHSNNNNFSSDSDFMGCTKDTHSFVFMAAGLVVVGASGKKGRQRDRSILLSLATLCECRTDGKRATDLISRRRRRRTEIPLEQIEEEEKSRVSRGNKWMESAQETLLLLSP